jgi:hypothetical protein
MVYCQAYVWHKGQASKIRIFNGSQLLNPLFSQSNPTASQDYMPRNRAQIAISRVLFKSGMTGSKDKEKRRRIDSAAWLFLDNFNLFFGIVIDWHGFIFDPLALETSLNKTHG